MVDRTLPTLNATSAPADNSIFLIRRNGQTEDEKVTGADLKSYMNNAPAISGGTIDNAVIGGTTPAAGTFTTLSSNNINTGQGAVECYAMDQAVRTTDSVTFSSLALTTDLAVAEGGTGASTASGARTNLGLVIGTDVQAYDAGLNSIAGLTTAADKGIYTTAPDTYATFDLTAGGRDLVSLTASPNTLPYFGGGGAATTTDLTAAGRALLDDANAAAQRTTLGLVIGTDVQAYDAGLNSIAGLTTAADTMIYTTASDTYATTSLTSFARTLLDDSSASAGRTTLGLGTIATQAANNVSITGGSITGITDLAVVDGGTGSSTAGGARTNLGLGTIATQDSNNVTISGGSITGIADLAIADGGTGSSTALGAWNNIVQTASTTVAGAVEKATEAEIESETADKYADAADLKFHPGVAKAWVNFNGTGTVSIRDNHNVSSITDNGTGDYTINLAVTMANANYATVFGTGLTGDDYLFQVKAGTTPSTTSFRCQGRRVGSTIDAAWLCAAIYGDQ